MATQSSTKKHSQRMVPTLMKGVRVGSRVMAVGGCCEMKASGIRGRMLSEVLRRKERGFRSMRRAAR